MTNERENENLEFKADGNGLIPVFHVIRSLTNLRLREGLSMEYALSVIADSQPQIVFVGPHGVKIFVSSNSL